MHFGGVTANLRKSCFFTFAILLPPTLAYFKRHNSTTIQATAGLRFSYRYISTTNLHCKARVHIVYIECGAAINIAKLSNFQKSKNRPFFPHSHYFHLITGPMQIRTIAGSKLHTTTKLFLFCQTKSERSVFQRSLSTSGHFWHFSTQK